MIPMLVVTACVLMNSEERAGTCGIVLLVTVFANYFYVFGPYDLASKGLGYYALQSLWPLLSVMVLSWVPGRLAACLCVLYSALIIVNGLFWWLEGVGQQIFVAYQSTLWLAFGVQTALMCSRSLTDGVYRALQRAALADHYPAFNAAGGHRSRGHAHHTGEG